MKNNKENIVDHKQIQDNLSNNGVETNKEHQMCSILFVVLFIAWFFAILAMISTLVGMIIVDIELTIMFYLITLILSIILLCITLVDFANQNKKDIWKNILTILTIVCGEIITIMIFRGGTTEKFTQVTGGLGMIETKENWWE